ncbi:hypothetical protein PM8797T_17944 [Gimesia maris DSM 8797]|nr:hypothetical protein PM8797T_17944 [Gimesia maris DSM 8797]
MSIVICSLLFSDYKVNHSFLFLVHFTFFFQTKVKNEIQVIGKRMVISDYQSLFQSFEVFCLKPME